MAIDEGVELETVKRPLSDAGEILTLWQDDDGSVGLTFASAAASASVILDRRSSAR